MIKKKQTLTPGTDNLTINMPIKLKKSIFTLSVENDMNASELCRTILQNAVDKGIMVETKTTIKTR